ncbi:uncharacterized protein Dmul_14150 [Desulfococcus multivorans]|nr:uncharacterized protein Dmul_14150 [Desulfococcus multivorans]
MRPDQSINCRSFPPTGASYIYPAPCGLSTNRCFTIPPGKKRFEVFLEKKAEEAYFYRYNSDRTWLDHNRLPKNMRNF